MNEPQRARLRRLVTELTDGGVHMAGMPRHKIGLVERLRELGRDDEAMRIEYGAGFSLYAGEDGVVWSILRPSIDSGSLRIAGRREQLFNDTT